MDSNIYILHLIHLYDVYYLLNNYLLTRWECGNETLQSCENFRKFRKVLNVFGALSEVWDNMRKPTGMVTNIDFKQHYFKSTLCGCQSFVEVILSLI